MNKFGVVASLLVCACSSCPAQKESLLIGSGDSITVLVLEAPELTQHVRVTDAGYVPLILGRPVKVSGLTPEQAAEAVADSMKQGDFVLNPHVTVTVDQYATQNITVLGEVKTPGAYPIATPRSVIEVLALAGGTTAMADRRVTIEHRGTHERVEYFLSNKSNIALDANATAYPGDIVLVPKAEVVYVMGDVARPGGYPMITNDGKLSLMQAVSLAGSHLPHAKQNSTRLIRKQPDGSYIETQIKLGDMEDGKQADLALQPDDIIYIPFSFIKNMGTNLSALVAATATALIYHY